MESGIVKTKNVKKALLLLLVVSLPLSALLIIQIGNAPTLAVTSFKDVSIELQKVSAYGQSWSASGASFVKTFSDAGQPRNGKDDITVGINIRRTSYEGEQEITFGVNTYKVHVYKVFFSIIIKAIAEKPWWASGAWYDPGSWYFDYGGEVTVIVKVVSRGPWYFLYAKCYKITRNTTTEYNVPQDYLAFVSLYRHQGEATPLDPSSDNVEITALNYRYTYSVSEYRKQTSIRENPVLMQFKVKVDAPSWVDDNYVLTNDRLSGGEAWVIFDCYLILVYEESMTPYTGMENESIRNPEIWYRDLLITADPGKIIGNFFRDVLQGIREGLGLDDFTSLLLAVIVTLSLILGILVVIAMIIFKIVSYPRRLTLRKLEELKQRQSFSEQKKIS